MGFFQRLFGPADADDFENRAHAHLHNGQYEEAIGDYTRALELSPQDAELYNLRGFCYWNLHRLDLALPDFDMAVRLDASHALAFKNRAFSFYCLGQYEEALRDYTRSIELDPNDADTYVSRGRTFLHSGKHESAVEDFSRAIRMEAGDAASFYLRAEAHRRLGEPDLAIVDYSRAIELDPNTIEIYQGRGLAYREKSRQKASEEERMRLEELAQADLHFVKEHRERVVHEVAREGKYLLTAVVQANLHLFEPGDEDYPAQVLLSFDQHLQDNPRLLLELAERMFMLKGTPQEDPDLEYVAALVSDEEAHEYERHLLPLSFTDGREVYAATLWVYRTFLHHGQLEERLLPCMAEPGDEGRLELVPFWFEER